MPYSLSHVQMRVATRLGPVRMAASPAGLAGLWFEGQRHEPLQHLHGVLLRTPVVNDANRDTVVEALRSIAELVIW